MADGNANDDGLLKGARTWGPPLSFLGHILLLLPPTFGRKTLVDDPALSQPELPDVRADLSAYRDLEYRCRRAVTEARCVQLVNVLAA